jgi:hypothetical protein
VSSGDRVLTAFFAARVEVSAAIVGLLGCGIAAEAIRVLPKSVHHVDDLGVRVSTKGPEGGALGAVLGGLVGAIAGALVAGGAIVVPSLGTVVAGPLVAALAGAGLGGALGVMAGALAGARLPEYEAAYLEDAVHVGGALVAVRCAADDIANITEILAANGALAVRLCR